MNGKENFAVFNALAIFGNRGPPCALREQTSSRNKEVVAVVDVLPATCPSQEQTSSGSKEVVASRATAIAKCKARAEKTRCGWKARKAVARDSLIFGSAYGTRTRDLRLERAAC